MKILILFLIYFNLKYKYKFRNYKSILDIQKDINLIDSEFKKYEDIYGDNIKEQEKIVYSNLIISKNKFLLNIMDDQKWFIPVILEKIKFQLSVFKKSDLIVFYEIKSKFSKSKIQEFHNKKKEALSIFNNLNYYIHNYWNSLEVLNEKLALFYNYNTAVTNHNSIIFLLNNLKLNKQKIDIQIKLFRIKLIDLRDYRIIWIKKFLAKN